MQTGIPYEDFVSVSDANSMGISKLISEAEQGRTKVVMRDDKPAAVITTYDDYNRIKHLDEMEQDIRLLALAVVRMATGNGVRHDLDDIAAEFGIDLSED